MTPIRATSHLSAQAMVAQQTHIQVKCLHECHMSFMKCHHAHIPSNSPTPLHMHMPSVKIVTGITNDLCIEPSPTLLHNVSNQSPVNPDSYHTTRSLYDKHDRVSSLGNKNFRITPQVSYTHVPGFSPKGVNDPLLAPPNTPYLYFFFML